MNRKLVIGAIVAVTALLAAGIAFAVTSSAPSSGAQTPSVSQVAVGSDDIPMLVLIDKLQLTHDKMQKVHDILASLDARVGAIQSQAQTLANDLLAFGGTEGQLNQRLADFRTSIGTPLQDAIKQLGDTLTINQGKILRQTLAERLAGLSGLSTTGLNVRTEATAPGRSGTETPAPAGRLELLRNRLQARQAAGQASTTSPAQTSQTQLAGSQRLLALVKRAEAGTPRLERLIKLLELKLAQAPA